MKLGKHLWPLMVCLSGLAPLYSSSVPGADRDRLREIVQDECLPHWRTDHNPTPCSSVSLVAAEQGYAVLPDRKGGAHFLLIPTQTISGVESPEIRTPGAINYFGAAWDARKVLEGVAGEPLPQDAVGLAVNHIHARSQDQLHIHMSCLGRAVHDELNANARHIRHDWSPVTIGGVDYHALRIMGTTLGKANPFELLAERLPDARQNMGEFTLLVAGMKYQEGPGFVVLAGREVPGAELLLDSTCAVAKPREAVNR